MTPPIAETGARLAALAEHFGFDAAVPAGEQERWHRVDRLVEDGLVDAMAAELVASEGRRDVAASYLGSRLVGPVVGRTVAALVLDQRCPGPAPDGVALRLHDDGWFDRVAFTRPTIAVLEGDPAAGHPGTVVLPDPAALRTWWAGRLVNTVAPLLDAVRERFAYGTRGLWGSLADRVGGIATAVDRERGGTGPGGWLAAGPLLDALAEHAPVPLTRPTPLPVPWSGGESWFSTKGTCCLYYRTEPDADPATGGGYCSTCPLVEPACRTRRLAAWLEDPTDD